MKAFEHRNDKILSRNGNRNVRRESYAVTSHNHKLPLEVKFIVLILYNIRAELL